MPEVEASLFQKEVKLLKTQYFQALVETKKRMRDELLMNLGTWSADPQVLVQYPFLQNVQSMINDYIDCFSVVETEDRMALVIDKDELSKRGLPENLSTIIEFGDDVIPPFSHIRTVLKSVQPIYKQVLEGMIKATR